ncbi:MAG: glutathione S-transferase family protein [Pseudomonadota bacterium]
MRFFDCQPAPSPRRVRIFIAEKGADIPVQQVDLGSGEHLGEAFRKINPDCTVPVLELDNGTALTETIAICDYLESQFPEPPLLGDSPESRAGVLQWNAKIEQQGLAAVAESFRNHAKGFRGRSLTGPEGFDQIPELVPRGRRRVEVFMAKLDAHLQDRPFICGDTFSMADITALVTIDMSAWIKLPIPESQPTLRAWHERVSSRPSARV